MKNHPLSKALIHYRNPDALRSRRQRVIVGTTTSECRIGRNRRHLFPITNRESTMKALARTSTFSKTSAIARRAVRRLLGCLALTTILATSAVAGENTLQHKYVMRGQVLEIDSNSLIACVGENDGAEVGQILDVVRHVPMHAHKGQKSFRRTDVGKVRITSLFDDHYASAAIVEGSPRANDSVELRAPTPSRGD